MQQETLKSESKSLALRREAGQMLAESDRERERPNQFRKLVRVTSQGFSRSTAFLKFHR